jgi:hypothetical protein
LVDKKDKETLAKINGAVDKFKTDPKAVTIWGSKFLASFKTPLRDGDTERDTDKYPEYKGHYFINANTYNKPSVVDAKMNDIIDKSELYSGCYGRVSIMPASYNVDGNKGIKFYLNSILRYDHPARTGEHFQIRTVDSHHACHRISGIVGDVGQDTPAACHVNPIITCDGRNHG